MCVALIIDKESRRPTLDEYKQMEWYNDDGAGVGWADHSARLCRWEKGLKAERVLELVEELFADPAMFSNVLVHFRFATHGGKDPLLTHPFIVSKDSPLSLKGETKRPLLIHNGVWSDSNQYRTVLQYKMPIPKEDKLWSDTRLGARFIAAGYMDAHEMGGKVAILQPDGGCTYFGDWKDKEGVLYSNLGWVGSGPGAWKGHASAGGSGRPRLTKWTSHDPKIHPASPGKGYYWDGLLLKWVTSYATTSESTADKEPVTWSEWRKRKESLAKKQETLTEATVAEITLPRELLDGPLFTAEDRRAMAAEIDGYYAGVEDADAGAPPDFFAENAAVQEALRLQGETLTPDEKAEIMEVIKEIGCSHVNGAGRVCAPCAREFSLTAQDLRLAGIPAPLELN